MHDLFGLAFARLDRAEAKRREFGEVWAEYISVHPWDIDVRAAGPCAFEILAVVREPAPAELSLVFSEWLASIRSALDNGVYAWVVAATGQNPPPHADRVQYPICSTPQEFRSQAKRLTGVPNEILGKIELAQPYQSPYGPESNLFYWVHELARTDRHRTPHVGLGRVEEHRIRLSVPKGVRAHFDDAVQPYREIEGELVLGRFTTSRQISRFEVVADLTGVGVGPEVRGWADFKMAGKRQTLWDRMVYTEIFTHNNLENMALFSGAIPPGGFVTISPRDPGDGGTRQ